MITIFHGDNEAKLHAALYEQIQAARQKKVEVVRLEAKKIEIATLEMAIGTDILFAREKLIVIEGLFALPKSKRKDALIAWIGSHDVPEISVLLIEKKALTQTQLKSFSKARSQLFKYPAILFQWLEAIGTLKPERELEFFHQVLEREEVELVFVMLVRQVRILLAFVSDGAFDGPPFLRSKVSSQAKFFSKSRLLALHAHLLSLDEEQKTSRSVLSLTQNLDLLLVTM